jgi:hypothetical protein
LLVFLAGRFAFHAGLAVDPSSIALVAWDVLSCAYLVVASVAVWQSAGPYWTSPIGMRPFWAGAARVVVVIGLANVAQGLLDALP